MANAGKDVLLKQGDGGSPTELFTAIAGFRSNTFEINGETVDVTNKDSGGWRMLLAGAGVTSITAGGSGTVEGDQAQKDLVSRAMDKSVHNYEMTVPGLGAFTGPFQVATFSDAGEFNGEATFDVSLESAGAVTFTPAA